MTASILTSELAELILRDGDGELNPIEADQLLEWLSASERHMHAYVEFAQLQAGLEWGRNAAGSATAPPSLASPPREPISAPVAAKSPPFTRLQSVAAILLIAIAYYGAGLVLFWGIGAPRTGGLRHPTPEFAAGTIDANQLSGAELASRNPSAVCLEERNCVWQDELPATLSRGSRLRLVSGTAILEFADGARIALQGPATLEIVSAGSGLLGRGKLTAVVPERAHGFTIDTPSLRIIDLGTEFGVSVDAAGDAEVHVFTGRVDAQSIGDGELGARVSLVAGQALAVRDAGQPGEQPAESRQPSRQIVQLKADRGLFAEHAAGPLSASLLAFYPFDGDANDASGGGHHAINVSGVTFVAGREGQAALFAGGANSFIDLPIDVGAAAVPDLTWGAWIKPAGPVMTRSEILSTDNFNFGRVLTIDNRRGVVGEKNFRIAAMAGPKVGVLLSQGPPPSAERWTFVAAVYRRDSKLLMLYVEDPSLAGGQGGLITDLAGEVEIGSSRRTIRVGNHATYSEPFAGAIDNVFIIRGALGHPHLEQFRTQGASAVLALGKNSQVQSTGSTVQSHP